MHSQGARARDDRCAAAPPLAASGTFATAPRTSAPTCAESETRGPEAAEKGQRHQRPRPSASTCAGRRELGTWGSKSRLR
eukprot:scaffold14519_cov135-Isochrysis_galbana.AAC.8